MAGDWIKLEHATLDKPEVHRFADLLGISHGDGLELLLRFWVWLDANAPDGCHGFVPLLSRKYLDNIMHTSGFSGALEAIGWLAVDPENGTISVPHFDYHNGKTSKTRALEQKRKKRQRSRSGHENVPQHAGPEKRRDITPIVPTSGFAKFWSTWPTSARKVNRKGCLERWTSSNLEPLADTIVAHVEAMKRTQTWRDGYDPAPATYLNQRRWEDASLPLAPPLPAPANRDEALGRLTPEDRRRVENGTATLRPDGSVLRLAL